MTNPHRYYRFPVVDTLRVVVLLQPDRGSSFVARSTIVQQLHEKLLCFQSSSSSSCIDSCHRYQRVVEEVACRVLLTSASGTAFHALLLFSPHYLTPLDNITSPRQQDNEQQHLSDDRIKGEPIYGSHMNNNCGVAAPWYGARITARTQVVVMKEESSGVWRAATYAFSVRPDLLQQQQLPSSELERCRSLWNYQSSEVRSSLLGYIDSVFGSAAITVESSVSAAPSYVDPTVHKCGSLLIVGESGSGASSLIHFSALHMHAKTVVLSSGTLYALAGGSRAVTAQWVRRQLSAATALAASLGRCVLLLEDLHALAPRRGSLSPDMRSVDVHEAIVEVTYSRS